MKKKGHPSYQEVVFVDTATGHKFLCGSTIKTDKTVDYEGKEYPAVFVPISSKSHPFFTGSSQLLDTEGRVDKFRKRYANKKAEPAPKEEPKQAAPAKKKAATAKKTTPVKKASPVKKPTKTPVKKATKSSEKKEEDKS